MGPWNILLTARPAPGAVHELLAGLRAHGAFHATPFKYVCVGLVADAAGFMDALLEAQRREAAWSSHVARVVPIAATFEFTPESLLVDLKAALRACLPEPTSASFFVRVERRGMAGKLRSPDIEVALADYLSTLAAGRGCDLRTSFTDPDYIVAVETLETQGGVGLITRDTRKRYPFVHVR